MEIKRKRVAIVGAAGFVGIELVSQLEPDTHVTIFTLTRENGSFLLDGKRVQLIFNVDDTKAEESDIVVNLAYPTVHDLQSFPKVNKQIFSSIERLVGPNTTIIQVSTQAIFGFGLEKPTALDFLKFKRDYAYIEAKLSMELMIKKRFPNNNKAFVRLGNVWGPGSGTWTAAIADRLLFGHYVGIEGDDGYANITDVRNVAAYLRYLINNSDVISGTKFYHLAEFSDVKWSTLIDMMAAELKVKPVYSDIKPDYPVSTIREFLNIVRPNSVGNVYRKMAFGRFTGSYMRSLTRSLGTKAFGKIKGTEKRRLPAKTRNLSNPDSTFLTIVTAKSQFINHTEASWKPALTFQQSWAGVKDWLKEAGYNRRA